MKWELRETWVAYDEHKEVLYFISRAKDGVFIASRRDASEDGSSVNVRIGKYETRDAAMQACEDHLQQSLQ